MMAENRARHITKTGNNVDHTWWEACLLNEGSKFGRLVACEFTGYVSVR